MDTIETPEAPAEITCSGGLVFKRATFERIAASHTESGDIVDGE